MYVSCLISSTELEDDLAVRASNISTQDINSSVNRLINSSVIQDLKQQIEDLQQERSHFMNQVHELSQRTSVLEVRRHGSHWFVGDSIQRFMQDLKQILSKLKFNINDELTSESVITTVSFAKSDLLQLKILQSDLGIDSTIESQDISVPPAPPQPDTVEPESELHSDKEKHTAEPSSSLLPIKSEVSENVPQLSLESNTSMNNMQFSDNDIEMKLKQTLQVKFNKMHFVFIAV